MHRLSEVVLQPEIEPEIVTQPEPQPEVVVQPEPQLEIVTQSDLSGLADTITVSEVSPDSGGAAKGGGG